MNNSNTTFHRPVILILFFIAGLFSASYAQLSPARIFTSGAVFQRNLDIPVWGTTYPEKLVVVKINDVTDSSYAGADGKFVVYLPPMSSGGPYSMTIRSENDTIKISDVYIGDVWLAAGQSNMAFALNGSIGGKAEIESANNQTIREFSIKNTPGSRPLEDVQEGSAWYPATSEYVGDFSAVAYYFAKNLQTDINIPIGIINASKGGARIEAFMSQEMLGFDENFVVLAKGEIERQPTTVFNTIINPIIQVPLKGIIWYQAESNADNIKDAIVYGDLFKRLIIDYRTLWGLGDLPFLWVQLPNQAAAADENRPGTYDAWPIIRTEQSKALSLPNTGEVVTIDLGEADIHPKDKKPVGERLAVVARNVVYGEDTICNGPKYKEYTLLDSGKVVIRFDNIGSGLIAKDSPDGSIHWFSIAGDDGKLYTAKAILIGDSVLVWNNLVPHPSTIRYAWEYNPQGVNLYNAEGLPTVPFLIKLKNPGYGIHSFTATDTLIERGKNVILQWETHKASSVTLNNEQVDSVDAVRLWPLATTTYILRTFSDTDYSKMDSLIITVKVIDPKPVITLSSDLGDLVPPESEIHFTADVFGPGRCVIKKVDFYVDDTLISTDSVAPYQTVYKSDGNGEYTAKAIVTADNGNYTESSPIKIIVAKLNVVTYEAENAVIKGNGTLKNCTATSNEHYMDMTDGTWSLNFDNVIVKQAGTYYLSIRYMLNYDPPKAENLLLNGTPFSELFFTGVDNTSWLTYRIKIPLKAGKNSITIQSLWGWISFDYITLTTEDKQ